MKKKNKHKNRRHNVIVGAIAALILAAAVAGMALLRGQKSANSEEVTLFLPSGTDYAAVVDSLDAHGCIANHAIFNTMARLRHYRDNVKGGCYVVKARCNLWSLLTKLYYGNQDPIHVTINKYRTKEQLSLYLDKRLELDADTLLALMADDSVCAAYGHTPQTIICMFVQNTYDIYWNISPRKLLDRMKKESDRFWNSNRMAKCKALNLNTTEVITLASIVEEETNKNDEKELIASVYLNRLRKGMLLQADPTLKFAAGDFTIQRLLNKHTESDSPYNTYRFRGLPPGPICIPGPSSIDAVLANRQTGYLYFCAKADFSGYHAFATTLQQHNANAAAFHAELNRRKIYK
ncbi:MAG: endolytic transglycosylase MltG [Prevotella sp.]|nr:endolytic transglycosylase MltG [Prevotella sp.]MBQ6955308.1 endolytic transglycosylase MltG [Bacteroidales bacterium]